MAALPGADAADLLLEQGIIDSAQRDWLRREHAGRQQQRYEEPFVNLCLREAARQECSDLHLVPDRPPLCRRHGLLGSLGEGWSAVSGRQIEEIVERIVPAGARRAVVRRGWLTLPYDGGGYRTRLTVGRDAAGYFLSFRLPFPCSLELDALGIKEARTLVAIRAGLILVTGGPGQGKSTLLAALAREVRRSRPGRTVLLGDPPEPAWEEDGFRTVRIAHCERCADDGKVLRAAFSLDPDLLLLDAPLAVCALPRLVEETARSGALVMATLGLRGVAEVLRRLCTEMPRRASRSLLACTLRAVVALELVPAATGKGRVAATEMFQNVPEAAAALLAVEPEGIQRVLGAGAGAHFQPIDDSLWRLFQQGRVTMEAAYARCRHRAQWVARMHAPTSPASRE